MNLILCSATTNNFTHFCLLGQELEKRFGWLKLHSLDFDELEEAIKKEWKNVILLYGTYYSYKLADYIERMKFENFWWIITEYDIGLEGKILKVLKKKFIRMNVISNFIWRIFKYKKLTNKYYMLNLNCFNFRDLGLHFGEGKYKCGYWGRFRKNRIESFKRFFDERMIVSIAKDYGKFKKEGIVAKFVKKLKFHQLKEFKFGLYIEDEKTHDNFNYLALRFYEMLKWGVIPLFDIKCKRNVLLSGYEIPEEFFVRDKEELWKRIEELEDKIKSGIYDEIFNKMKIKALKEKEDLYNKIQEILS